MEENYANFLRLGVFILNFQVKSWSVARLFRGQSLKSLNIDFLALPDVNTRVLWVALVLLCLCNCNKIKDETHFLLDCPSYSSIRERFFSKIEPKIRFLRLLSHETLLSRFMNCTDYFINIQLISFISSCFEQRDKLVTIATSLNG